MTGRKLTEKKNRDLKLNEITRTQLTFLTSESEKERRKTIESKKYSRNNGC